MKKFFLSLLVMGSLALTTIAQCPPPMQCDPPPGEEPPYGDDYTLYIGCYQTTAGTGMNDNGTWWIKVCWNCEVCNLEPTGNEGEYLTHCLGERQNVGCYYINRIASLNPLTPKGIDVNEFDVLRHLSKDTPAYASLRIPKDVI